ncbi:DUF1697 domain-containing protein [Agromyces sp. G08B096]|uniref:DUF1697 domain-containing protein n=1 Tax=Agromyces sp. G08B096 TaxID=3156399 RepID=A0AAU7WBF3_9MICO
MTLWVALLRGVNVGGVAITSAELRELASDLGFEDVRTVLASGNVVFSAGRSSSSALRRKIEGALEERFGYDAHVVLVELARLRRIVDDFPFDDADRDRQPYVVFATEASVLGDVLDAAGPLDEDVDPIERGDGVLYWNPVKGTTLKTPFAKVTAKPPFAPELTTRNLRTLRKVLA